jgi:DNA-binding CsgD family transcriptional regulator
VAELAVEGATNRDIGRRLYLSPKTIEMHLRSVYRKLDIPGRGHLAAALR